MYVHASLCISLSLSSVTNGCMSLSTHINADQQNRLERANRSGRGERETERPAKKTLSEKGIKASEGKGSSSLSLCVCVCEDSCKRK